MQYVSTRGTAPTLEFSDVLLSGLATDGGLYVPSQWPQFSPSDIKSMAGRDYNDVAFQVMKPFIGGDIPDDQFRAMIEAAYSSFSHSSVAPLYQLGPNHWLMELFHGPTLAFKDVAMQLLARLMNHTLSERGRRATIVGATSGDTGGAAIEAFRGLDAVDMFILHPNGKVSDVQRRQMTTVPDRNVHNIAINGTFDDCQTMVKGFFNDPAMRKDIALAGVNSINWARIMAQVVYYFTTAVALGAPDRSIRYCVPTGNFGDIFAGFAAKRMGLPIDRLIIATNVNDILLRTLDSGRYEMAGVVASQSPSMDIQISSNFERLLFEANNRDSDAVIRLMSGLTQSGAFSLSPEAHNAIRREFSAGRSDEGETTTTIARVHTETGIVIDPHTAVGVSVAERHLGQSTTPLVTLSTAHPAKFPDAIKAAIGRLPEQPEQFKDMAKREEKLTVLDNDPDVVKAFIIERSRATQVTA